MDKSNKGVPDTSTTAELVRSIVAEQRRLLPTWIWMRKRGEHKAVQDVRDRTLTHQECDSGKAAVGTWSAEGLATLEVTGSDIRSTLEAGLRAVLSLSVASAIGSPDLDRSTPIRGEGDDLASLFVDMVDDLLEQIESYGAGLQDVVVDGVLIRDGSGYVGWGYASGTLDPASMGEVPRLLGNPEVSDSENQGIVLRATLQRP